MMDLDRSELINRIKGLDQHYFNFQKFRGPLSKNTQSLADRIRRAISWLKRAQVHSSDLPPRYVDLWISFNALYGVPPPKRGQKESELTNFQNYLKCLLATSDKAAELKNLMDSREVSEISTNLMSNKYLCKAFWDYALGNHKKHIKDDLDKLKQTQNSKLEVEFFSLVFLRLLVLRNQIFHGSSSSATVRNQDALLPGCRLLEIWLPTFLDLMLNCTRGKEGMWPPVPYPGRGTPQHPKD